MWKSAWGWLGTTRDPQETRPRVPRLFERLEPRLLLSVVFEVKVQPTDPVTPDQYAIYLEQQAEEQWVPYIPTAEQTVISMISDEAGTRATVTITLPSAGYRVTDWGTVQQETGRLAVNVQVELWTGPSEAVVTKLSHEYDFGQITGGPREFAFYAWEQYIESRWFTPGMEFWAPYVPTAEQTGIFIAPSDTGMKATVTLSLPWGYAYAVREWGTIHQVGNTFTVNAEVERLEGVIVLSEAMIESHEYDLGTLAAGDYVFEFRVWDQLIESREFRPGSEQWVQYMPTAEQTNILILADGAGGTKARVAINFFDSGYRVHDWGTVRRTDNTFSVNAEVEKWTGVALCVITPVYHDYDLGSLPDGNYEFRFNAWQERVESKEFTTPATLRPVYRFWSPALERHFYTLRTGERDKLINNYSDVWTYEQVAYYAFATDTEPGTAPVYRFWSGTLNTHFYTARQAERDKLIDNYSQTWAYEGIAFYAYPHSPGYERPIGTDVVYRSWSSSLNSHFFTASDAEMNKLLSLPTRVWEWEGVAWYAYAPVILDRQPA
jgi:hypothetical protein